MCATHAPEMHSESVTNAKKLSMIVYPSPGGSQISIMCYHQNTGFKFDTIKSVLIRGIRFVGCGKNIASILSSFPIQLVAALTFLLVVYLIFLVLVEQLLHC